MRKNARTCCLDYIAREISLIFNYFNKYTLRTLKCNDVSLYYFKNIFRFIIYIILSYISKTFYILYHK